MTKANQQNHYLYNAKLKPLARALRRNMTKAEACLWKYVLKDRMLKGHAFNRQRVVRNHVTDFLSKKLLLVVEVDGASHDSETIQKKDIEKERTLKEAGFLIVRFTDEEVLNNIDAVRQTLEYYVEEREKSLEFPPPVRLAPSGLRRTSPS